LRLRAFGGLWIGNLDADSDAGTRPRPLALLAILALAGAKGVSRDHVLGVLWPEAEEERARQSLSQAIYSLKRDLGIDVAASAARLRLDAQQMRVLPRFGTERRHDLRRHREEPVAGEPEPVGGGGEDVLEPRRGVAVRVQRAGEPQHEADGEWVRIVAALERRWCHAILR